MTVCASGEKPASAGFSLKSYLATIFLGLLLCLLYWPGIHGPFLVDDFVAIVDNPAVRLGSLSLENLLRAAFSSSAGPLGRPLPMASFAIDHAMGGLAPEPFKLTNILLHLVNALLVFSVSRVLLGRLDKQEKRVDWQGPLLVTALWALHPLHVSTVLYVVQRMSQLAMLFVMAALWVYIDARNRMLTGDVRSGWLRAILFVPPLFAGALFSKENGALLPALLLVTEAVFFRFSMPPGFRLSRRALVALLWLPTLVLLGYLVWIGLSSAGSGTPRDFSPVQRTLTESRMLATYLAQLAWPDPARMPFYYDDFVISKGLIDPPATLAAAFFWTLLLCSALLCVWCNQAPLFSFAVLWFLGGHMLESTVIPLEPGFEHRNYLPSYGVAFGAGIVLWRLAQLSERWSAVSRLLLVGIPVILALQLHQRVTAWSSEESFFIHALRNAPGSARVLGDYSLKLSAQGMAREAIVSLLKAAELNRREAGYQMVAIHLTANTLGEEPAPELLHETLERLRNRPMTAYSHNILSVVINPLIEQTITPRGRQALKQMLEAASDNPTLRPNYRKLVALALIYLVKQPVRQ